MPTTKTANIFFGLTNEILFKNIKAKYNTELDYYSIKIQALIEQFNGYMQEVEWLYIKNDDGEKYNFSNLYIEKSENRVNITAIFEKDKNNQFNNNEDIQNIFNNSKIQHIKNDFVSLTKIDLSHLNSADILKNAYLNGTYEKIDNETRHFASVLLKKQEQSNIVDVYVNYEIPANNTMMFLRNNNK